MFQTLTLVWTVISMMVQESVVSLQLHHVYQAILTVEMETNVLSQQTIVKSVSMTDQEKIVLSAQTIVF